MSPGQYPARTPVIGWLLRWIHGAEEAGEILIELRELGWYERRERGALRARLLFWRESLRHAAGRQLRGGMDPDDGDGGPGLGAWLTDTRHALRKLRHSPLHSVITVAVLGLGIGAVTAVFSLVNMLLFATLPFAQPDRLFTLEDVLTRPGQPANPYTPQARSLYALRDLLPEVDLAGHRFGTFRVHGGDVPTQVIGVHVTDRWFETVGVRPFLGRGFSQEQQAAGAGASAAMIGHDLWQRRFGADTSIVDTTVLLNGQPHLISGVMPPGLRFPWGSEVWVQSEFDRTATFSLGTVMRVPEGTGLTELRAQLAVATDQVAQMYPETHTHLRFNAKSLRDYLVDNRAGVAWMLLAAVAMLLLLACANVAGLATVRVLGQGKELAVRAALGSGRGRLFRLVFIEGALLAASGGLLGLAVAVLLQRSLASLGSAPQSGVGLVLSIGMDYRVVGFTTLTTGLAAVLASTLPALRALNSGRAGSLLRTRGGGEDRTTGRLLSATLASQAGIGAVLLIVSVTVAQAYMSLESTERGYEGTDRQVLRVVLPDEDFPGGDGRWQHLEQMARQIEESPDVVAAGYTHHLPMTPGTWTRPLTFEALRDGVAVSSRASVRWVGTSYLDAIGIDMLAGRSFTAEEMEAAAPVVVISAGLAARMSDNPATLVGGRVTTGSRDEDDRPWLEVVGVAEQAQEEWIHTDTVYLPYSDVPHAWVEMVVHVQPGTGVRQLAAWLPRVDPEQPVDDVRSLATMAATELQAERLATQIVGVLAVGGLIITLLGTYGLVSFRVGQRRRDLGIRMALGCDSRRLVWHVVSRGVALVAVGFMVGALLTWVLVPPLFGGSVAETDYVDLHLLNAGLSPDPGATSGSLGLVLLTASLASLIPVLRALASNPLSVLRED